ncbi:MAG: DNRLRE domain-containing protein [Candidatus Aegiribacteria sp.]
MNTKTAMILTLLLISFPVSSHADQVTLYPSDDADVWQGSPDVNRGAEQSFQVGYDGSGFWRNALIKFDVTGISGTVINSATLRLRLINSWGDFPTDEIYIARNSSDWEEMTVTWNNKPGFAESMPIAAPSVIDWWEIDVTEWIQDIVDGTDPNYGFQIYQADTDYAGFSMRTKEGVFDPELVVNYSPADLQSTTFGSIKALLR